MKAAKQQWTGSPFKDTLFLNRQTTTLYNSSLLADASIKKAAKSSNPVAGFFKKSH